MGEDVKKRPIRWRCPGTCSTHPPEMDPFGCHSTPDVPLHERWPERFADAPGPVPHCPWRVIRDEWTPWLEAVLNLCADIAGGRPPVGWPDRYTAGVVDAVRYVQRQTDAASAASLERR